MTSDAEKASGKIQHQAMIKTLTKVGTEGRNLNAIKAIDDKCFQLRPKLNWGGKNKLKRKGGGLLINKRVPLEELREAIH